MHCIVNITMSVFVMSTTLHFSKLTFESSVANSLNKKTYLQAVCQTHQTVLAKLELPHFIETAFVHSYHCRLLSQVQETVLRKLRCTHSNILVELFWNCYESWPCTSVYSPPEVTRSPHGLLHYTNCWTKTTFPIIHCTDNAQLITLITQLITLITQLT